MREIAGRAIRRLGYWLRRRRHQAELAEEMAFHREMAGRRAFGNEMLAREDAVAVWIAPALDAAWRDAVYGARALRREPAFALTALITLTVGVAVTTTVFTIADAELWKPLPFPSPRQLVAVHALGPGTVQNSERIPAPDFLDWQRGARLAEYAAQGTYGNRTLRRQLAERVSVQAVTTNYFTLLGVEPRIGRGFLPGQDDRAPVALLSDRGWRRIFNADPGAVGRRVSLDGTDYAVVGAFAGQHLEFGTDPDFYVVLDPAASVLRDRSARMLTAIGRVRAGASPAQAQAELDAITARITQAFPAEHVGHRVQLEDLRDYYQLNNARALYLFLAAAALVLLMASLNVASLLLARALRRQREFAIRGALGGGRAALVRQLVVEGALLAVPSAVAGTLLSFWAAQLFVAQVPDDFIGRGSHFVFDARIAALVTIVSALTTVLLSLAPLVPARRVDLNMMLGHGGRTAGRTPAQLRMRTGLLIAQLAVTLMLMVAAGLFLSSFAWLVRAPLGFETRDRLALRLTVSGPAYETDAAKRTFAERLLDAARATPGVAQASIDSSSPLLSGPLMRAIAADRPRPRPGDEARTIIRAVSPDYFAVLGIAQLDGRMFSASDVDGAPRVAVINEYLASELFPGQRAVGRRLELIPSWRQSWTDRPGVVEIVGVVGNGRDVSLEEVQFADIFVPFAQAPAPTTELIVRASIPVDGLVAPLRTAAASLDPSLPIARIETLEGRIADSLKGARFNVILIASFALVAILLACVGVYGAMACAVQERSREFGVRLALGQPSASILRGTVWQSARLGLAASALGLTASLLIARLIGNALYLVRGEHSGVLHGVTTTDPLSLSAATAGLVLIATISALIPARQATRVDPLVVLRSE